MARRRDGEGRLRKGMRGDREGKEAAERTGNRKESTEKGGSLRKEEIPQKGGRGNGKRKRRKRREAPGRKSP